MWPNHKLFVKEGGEFHEEEGHLLVEMEALMCRSEYHPLVTL